MNLGAVILAAGASTRMGKPKMLLPWGGTNVLSHLITQWQNAGATQVAVVCDPAACVIQTELDQLGFSNRVFNPNPGQGMFSSIRCAVHWNHWHSALTHWAIILGDQPHLHPATLATLISAIPNFPGITQPSFREKPRHPVILPRDIFFSLKGTNARTLKEFLSAQQNVTRIEIDDPGLDLDIDCPEDYQRATRLASAQPKIISR